MTKHSHSATRLLVITFACALAAGLTQACNPTTGSVAGATPPPANPPPANPPKMDAQKGDPGPTQPPPASKPDAGPEVSAPEPTPPAPDAAADVAVAPPEVEPPVDDTPDAMAPGDGGAAQIVVGQRVSLRGDLAAKWVGARRSIKDENGAMVFTGVFEANKFGGPQGHNVRLPLKPGTEYVFEYRIRFDTNFDFSRGGKIPGLAGGNAPTGCVNVDANGFSARMMWREGGKLIGYLYDQDQSVACGDGISTSFNFKIGMWHDVKERVKLNTGSNNNGTLQIWIDGNMVINRSNVEYMAEKPTNRINSILFHSFFGGSTQDWAPRRNCSLSFSEPFVTLVTE